MSKQDVKYLKKYLKNAMRTTREAEQFHNISLLYTSLSIKLALDILNKK